MEFAYPEGATPIDPDESAGLRLTHITTQAELNRWEQENILEAIEWLARTKPADILNEKFVKDLYKRMFNSVWEWAGQFRQSDKNIGGPWQQVSVALRNLCDDAAVWTELREESDDEIGVRFHHRLVSIHPFANGNGRHARLMTDVLLQNVLNAPRFSWGREDLSEAGGARSKYIAALKAADNGDYGPLLSFVRA